MRCLVALQQRCRTAANPILRYGFEILMKLGRILAERMHFASLYIREKTIGYRGRPVSGMFMRDFSSNVILRMDDELFTMPGLDNRTGLIKIVSRRFAASTSRGGVYDCNELRTIVHHT